MGEVFGWDRVCSGVSGQCEGREAFRVGGAANHPGFKGWLWRAGGVQGLGREEGQEGVASNHSVCSGLRGAGDSGEGREEEGS